MKISKSVIASLLGFVATISPTPAWAQFGRLPRPADAQPGPVIRVSDGQVRGIVADGVERWLGIPFAAPPVGQLRWRAPQPVTPWAGVLETSDFKDDPTQGGGGGRRGGAANPSSPGFRANSSEDCLYVNVWRASGTKAQAKLPVLVWIYGGAWQGGGSSEAPYSGANLAKQGIMVVSLNYRLGHFGWFAHPQLTRENLDNGQFYNYGTMDQIGALKWVQRNIAAFGGDPNNVTIMGESAGGVSVHALVTSPQTEGLFHKGIIMSGANGDDFGTGGLADAEGLGLNLAQAKGIAHDDPQALVKLRAMSTAEIQAARAQATSMGLTTFVTGGPVEEGKVVAEVGQAYESGNFRKVPLMIGATSGDMGGRTGFMIAGARRISNTLADKVPVYYYRFSYVGAGRTGTTAAHASELYFFFNNQAHTAQKSEHDEVMGRIISGYVVRFVKTDPRNPNMGGWPRYQRTNGKMMDFTLNGTAQVMEDPWADELDSAPRLIYPGLMIGGASRRQGPRAGGAAPPPN